MSKPSNISKITDAVNKIHQMGPKNGVIIGTNKPVGVSIQSQFRPTGDLVVLEKVPEFETIIVTPDNVEDKTCHGIVLAIGPGRMTESGVVIKPECKVGDKVFFNPQNMIPLKLGDRQLFLLQGLNVMGIFDPADSEPALEA